MALLLKSDTGTKPVFMHVHKTGGSWTRSVLALMGSVEHEIGGQHTQIAAVREAQPDLWAFGFVREPFYFLRSYFLHRYRHGWINRDLDNACKANTFEEFLDKYLHSCPGWVGRWFDLYLDGAMFIGRYENLRQDLIRALTLAGVPHNRNDIMRSSPINVTPLVDPAVSGLGWRHAELYLRVMTAEADAYQRFYPYLLTNDPTCITR